MKRTDVRMCTYVRISGVVGKVERKEKEEKEEEEEEEGSSPRSFSFPSDTLP